MFQQLLNEIFSNKCQLISLELDITQSFYSIHQCLNSDSHLQSKTIFNEYQSYCLTLRRLHIRLDYRCFLEHLIEHVPNLEQLSVHFQSSLDKIFVSASNIETLVLSNGNWYNKIPKLEYFTLKCYVINDLEFGYLKWLLNNVNHVKKLKIYLYSGNVWKTNEMIWRSLVDANFIRQYCLPNQIINLEDFRFYIRIKCQLPLNDIEMILNSFKINPFFISHQWTNVKCFYDKNNSYQHIFSSILDKHQSFDHLLNYHSASYDLLNIRHIKISFDPSLYSLFEQFNELCPDVSCVTIDTECSDAKAEMLATLFKFEQQNLNKIQFVNVTKLQFGCCRRRATLFVSKFTAEDKVRAKLFARLISMPVQLKYLSLEKFQWLLYVIENAFDDLKENALSAVRHAEFGLPSCNIGKNESTYIGKQLVPFISTYMSHLQTLCLWRPDDFPWTSIRPSIKPERYGTYIRQWRRKLEKFPSINEHAIVFQQDLSQLIEQLKHFMFIDIYGLISFRKVESYRLMIQTHFPNSQFDVQISSRNRIGYVYRAFDFNNSPLRVTIQTTLFIFFLPVLIMFILWNLFRLRRAIDVKITNEREESAGNMMA
ncbi:unnamed protein product [Adineta steineri]|uniref:Uncharacterized protein n=1 Tax=Adineta steineri TaxID=433720 RepID=A0A813Y1L3_9BILA|nr:unnamed protein product [Adineta steineri]